MSRDRSLDAVRGAAVVLMVGVHVAAAAGVDWPNETVGRAAMPLFMFVAGYLLRPRLTWRHLDVLAAGVVAQVSLSYLFGNDLGILLLFVLVLPLALLWYRVPWVGVLVGVVQVGAFPLDYAGFQPGLVVACLCVGRLAAMSGVPPFSVHSRSAALEAVGRWPLSVYVGHLALLSGAVFVSGL